MVGQSFKCYGVSEEMERNFPQQREGGEGATLTFRIEQPSPPSDISF